MRNTHPSFSKISSIPYPKAKNKILVNGLPIYTISAGTQEIVKIDFQYKAGSYFQTKSLQASATCDMLTEGTRTMTSGDIAKKLDYYGAFIRQFTKKDFAYITLFSLKKYLKETILIAKNIIEEPLFPEDELRTYLNKKKQHWKVEKQKVSKLSRDTFNEMLFGKNHPYGEIIQEKDFSTLSVKDLKEFHLKYYTNHNLTIIASGMIDDYVFSVINAAFGKDSIDGTTKTDYPEYTIQTSEKKLKVIELKDKVQSSIRMGMVFPNQVHPDYPYLNIINTALGGYFGSRLMKKIREEKGYTYGIYSMIVSMAHSGYFVIAGETGSNVTQNAVNEIRKEIEIIKRESVGYEELETLRNYMMGDLMRSFDGPFAISEVYKNLLEFGLREDHYENIIQSIQNISPDIILEYANKYLNNDDMKTVVAGKY